MKMQRLSSAALSAVLIAGALLAGAAQAQDQALNKILKVGQTKTSAGQQSQKRIEKLQQETNDLASQYKIINKEIEGLRVYNAQLERQLANQRKVIKELEGSIDNVTVIERQIQPLILKMLDGLEQFVELDLPFQKNERNERIVKLRANQDRADITVAEKFRQVLEAYNIESEYGRSLYTYTDTLNVNGQDRSVEILGVGRIALMYQTTDQKFTGAWNQNTRTWEELPAAPYRSAVQQGIKIAKKQASQNVMALPILAPVEASK